MSWKSLVLHNFWWKVTALVLATAVWLIFKSERAGDQLQFRTSSGLVHVTSTRDFLDLPIRILKAAGDHREFRVRPASVDITVSGDYALLKRLHSTDIQPFVDVTTMGEDVTTNAVQIVRPAGVLLDQAIPEIVTLEEIPHDERAILPSPDGLVHVKSFIQFPDIPVGLLKAPGDSRTFQVEPAQVDVRVSGDVALLEKLSARDIHAFIDLTDLDQAIATNRVLMTAPPGLRLEQASPAVVQVKQTNQPANFNHE